MPGYSYGRMRLIDDFQRKLDQLEKTWPMTGSYERLEPYLVPYVQGRFVFELLVFHIESKLWFDNTNRDCIVDMLCAKPILSPGSVAFDLGSNIGALTLPLAAMVGELGHVHAFDPYPWNTAATRCNAALNHFGNVTAYEVGISNKDYRISVSPNDSRVYEASTSETAQELTIASIAQYVHLKPTFLKIDIEGAEHDLFEDLPASTLAGLHCFALEFHPSMLRARGIDPRTTLENIKKAGFSLHYYAFDTPEYPVNAFDDGHHLFWGKRQEHVAAEMPLMANA